MPAFRFGPSSTEHCTRLTSLHMEVSKHLADMSLSLPNLIGTAQTTKARLLHYFPPEQETAVPIEDEPIDSWCGFHLDNSLLTGLCSVSYSCSTDRNLMCPHRPCFFVRVIKNLLWFLPLRLHLACISEREAVSWSRYLYLQIVWHFRLANVLNL